MCARVACLVPEGPEDPGVSGGGGEERGGSGRTHHLRVQRDGPGQPQLHVHGDGQHGHHQGERYHGDTRVLQTSLTLSLPAFVKKVASHHQHFFDA